MTRTCICGCAECNGIWLHKPEPVSPELAARIWAVLQPPKSADILAVQSLIDAEALPAVRYGTLSTDV